MSAKAGSIGGIVLGAVAIVAGIVAAAIPGGQAGIGLIIMGIGLVAGGAVGLSFNPQSASQDMARPKDIQVATAGYGFPIPIVFGEQRVVGNFMYWNDSQFESIDVHGPGQDGGGKGGDADDDDPIIGHEFKLTWEYALCMGPIDYIGQVWSVPGELAMRGNVPGDLVFASNEDSKEFILDSKDPTNQSGSQTGMVRFFKGSDTQWRTPANDPYQTGAELNTGYVRAGYVYKITARTGSNFTTAGAASNAVGTIFQATVSVNGLLDANNRVIEYRQPNYRNIAWCEFMKFNMGRFPQPRTYHFIIGRHPAHDTNYDMKRPDGTVITGFKVRGSNNAAHINYKQCNPAAMIYEAATNELWGGALPQTMFTEQSFIDCSTFFINRNIGMGHVVTNQEKLPEYLNGLMSHLNMVLIYDGETLKLKCLLDPAQTHAKINRLDKNDVINLKVVRPLWKSTLNEVRCEFNDYKRNYRPNSTHVQDLANIAINGGRIASRKIAFNAFVDFNTARRQAIRLLRDIAYPALVAEFELNRFKSQIEVGDCVSLTWDEYGKGEVTVYFLVKTIQESTSDEDNIRVVAVEDPNLSAVEGRETGNIITTAQPWEKVPDLNYADLYLFDKPTGVINQAITPITAVELSPFATRGLKSEVLFMGQRPSPLVLSAKLFYARQGKATFTGLGKSNVTCVTGTLLTDFTGVDYWDRSATGFQFSLTDPDQHEATVLACNLVNTAEQHLEDLIESNKHYLVIGEEIMQVGVIEQVGTNQYRARNIVRGCFGSEIYPHFTNDKIFYSLKFLPRINTSNLPAEKLQWKAYPVTRGGVTQIGNVFFTKHHRAGDDTKHQKRGLRPFAPEIIKYSTYQKTEAPAGFLWGRLRFRFRYPDQGAGIGPFFGIFDEDENRCTGSIARLVKNPRLELRAEFISDTGINIFDGPLSVDKVTQAEAGRIADLPVAGFTSNPLGGGVLRDTPDPVWFFVPDDYRNENRGWAELFFTTTMHKIAPYTNPIGGGAGVGNIHTIKTIHLWAVKGDYFSVRPNTFIVS